MVNATWKTSNNDDEDDNDDNGWDVHFIAC